MPGSKAAPAVAERLLEDVVESHGLHRDAQRMEPPRVLNCLTIRSRAPRARGPGAHASRIPEGFSRITPAGRIPRFGHASIVVPAA